MEYLISDMEDCSVVMESVHEMMALCFACGLIFGGIMGAWISSRALARQLREHLEELEKETD